ncbi:neuronal acetylcholine receptor subunit alpha-3-like [Panulirus ornatus]|uniref:neuronal acetylcholine receptor subunit alpha-3-like n=1 Tax=Panulirus ornatus TaxID=150431 RepID=UPI003A8413E4
MWQFEHNIRVHISDLPVCCALPAIPVLRVLGQGLQENEPASPEHRLFNDLFSKYDKRIRPVLNPTDVSYVFFELSLFNLLYVNTQKQKITTNSEVIMKWLDVYLKWDPKEYNDTYTIRVPYEEIWYPDVIMENTAESDYESSFMNTNAIITHLGEVELASHAVLTSVCIMDVQWYPFDQQTCKMTFASWSHDNTRMLLIKGPADLSEYSQNPEFFLENFYAELHEIHNPCCLNPMSSITYFLQIQRRTIFSLFFFIMPGILINMCECVGRRLPGDSRPPFLPYQEDGVMATPVEKMEESVDVDGTLVRVFTVQPQKPKSPTKEPKPEIKKYMEEDFDPAQLKDPFQRHALAALESMNKILMREEKDKAKGTMKSNLVEQWKFVSRVMDRSLFITFTSICFLFNLIILTSSPFRQLFSYCPEGEGMCEGLTMEEIMDMTSHVAAHAQLPGVQKDSYGGDEGGGHGAPSSAHLNEDHNRLVGIRVGPAYEGYEGLGLLPDYGTGSGLRGL